MILISRRVYSNYLGTTKDFPFFLDKKKDLPPAANSCGAVLREKEEGERAELAMIMIMAHSGLTPSKGEGNGENGCDFSYFSTHSYAEITL